MNRATWLALLAYCHAEENGGVIPDASQWPDRKWQQVVAVTSQEVREQSDLWFWDGDTLTVKHYPTCKQEVVEARRTAGKKGALNRWQKQKHGKPDGKSEVLPDGKSENQPYAEQNVTERNVTEPEQNEKARDFFPIDGAKLEAAIKRYGAAADKRFSSEALKAAVRQIQAGVIDQDALCLKLDAIARTAQRNPKAERQWLPSCYDLIEHRQYDSELSAFLSGKVADHTTAPMTNPPVVEIF